MLTIPMNKTLQKSGTVARNLPAHGNACRHAVSINRFMDVVSMVHRHLATLFTSRQPAGKTARSSQDIVQECSNINGSSQENPDSPLSDADGIVRELAERHPTLFMT